MSKNILNHFRYLLFSGKINDLTDLYYGDKVKVVLSEPMKTSKKTLGIDTLKETLKSLQILQFEVFDLKQLGNSISYGIYMVTRNSDNTIDFSEHHIVNKWKNNLIEQHHHTIINN